METENPSNNAAIIEAVERLAVVSKIELVSGAPVALVVPAGKQVVSIKKYIDEWADRPDRMKGTARVTTLQSFIDHANRFKDRDSVIFADVSNSARLLAVFDYNQAGENLGRPELPHPRGLPRFGQHRAEYRFPVSKEWEAWTAAAKKGMSLVDFAEFLEEHLPDVMDPEEVGQGAKQLAVLLGIALAGPQRLLELSRGLFVKVGHAVTAFHNASSGEAQLAFEEKHTDDKGGPLRIPGGFVIGIPVFRNGRSYQLPVRLRYRVADRQVTWFLSIQRADRAFDLSVEEAAVAAREATELPLVFGTPED